MIRTEPFFHVCRSGCRVTPSFSVYPFLFFPARVLSRPCLLRIHFFSPLHPFMTHALPVSGPGCRLPPLRNEKSRPAVCRSGSFSHGRSYGGMGYLSFSGGPLFSAASRFAEPSLCEYFPRYSPLSQLPFCGSSFAVLFCGLSFAAPYFAAPLLRPLFCGLSFAVSLLLFPFRGPHFATPFRGPFVALPFCGPPGKAIFGTGRG